MPTVIVATAQTSGRPWFGGWTWVPLQWVLGFARLGVECYWVDRQGAIDRHEGLGVAVPTKPQAEGVIDEHGVLHDGRKVHVTTDEGVEVSGAEGAASAPSALPGMPN